MRFQHHSIAGAIALVGCSIFALAAAVIFSTLGNSALAGGGSAAPAVAAAAMAQGGGEPTIVWYGTYGGYHNGFVAGAVVRAWSDGTVELKRLRHFHTNDACSSATDPCSSAWIVISSPNDGLAAFADLNADAKVDGVDLAQVLSNWGPAPRNDIPPSNCPLNLVNP